MLDFGPEKILFLAAIALVFVGPKKMPELARSVGRALREIRRVEGGVRADLQKALNFTEDSTEDSARPSAGGGISRTETHSVVDGGEGPAPDSA